MERLTLVFAVLFTIGLQGEGVAATTMNRTSTSTSTNANTNMTTTNNYNSQMCKETVTRDGKKTEQSCPAPAAVPDKKSRKGSTRADCPVVGGMPCQFLPTTPLLYTVVRIDDLNFAGDLNDSGEVSGQIPPKMTDDGMYHAALWRQGQVIDLGLIGCRRTVSRCWSTAFGLNNNTIQGGDSHVPSPWPSPYHQPWSVYYAHETLWRDGQARAIRTIGWEFGKVYDVNDRGTAVGSSRDTDWSATKQADYLVHGFVYFNDRRVYRIGDLQQQSVAYAVNERDQVTGKIDIGNRMRAFLWDNGTLRDIGHLGGFESYGNDINDHPSPMIVGHSVDQASQVRAFVWRDGVMRGLPHLPGENRSSASGVNNGGDIVGASGDRAVIWRNERVYDLNRLLTRSPAERLTVAVEINNRGQILARGARSYYLLTPAN